MRILAVLLAVSAASAQDRDVRRLHEWRQLDLATDALAFKEGIELGEGPRGMRDAFPFIVAAAAEDRAAKRGTMLTPKNLGRFLADGIKTPEQAMAAARLFVAGPIVKTDDQAKRVIAAARKLPKELGVKVHPDPPLGRRPSVRGIDTGFRVSFTALEMDVRMRLVVVTADVARDGTVAIETEALVDGPQLTWQTASSGKQTAEKLRRAELRRRQVETALLESAAALELEVDRDAAWALARVLHHVDDVVRVFRAPTNDWGKTARMCQWTLPDGTVATFGGPRREGEPTPIEYAGLSLRAKGGGGMAGLRSFRHG